MIKKKVLIDYFGTYGDLITTEKGVEIALHADSVIEVSVLIRNVMEISINGLEPMLQLHAEFTDYNEFVEICGIAVLEDLKRLTVADMIRMYAAGRAELEEIDY